MLPDIAIFAGALLLVVQGAVLATRYAGLFAESFRLSTYTVGFIVVAVISILPETFISVNAALEGIPSFGLGMLLGSNVTDLTLIFALIIFLAGRNLKVESTILKRHALYPFFLILPLVLGLDGDFSRLEGVILLVAGVAFYYFALKGGKSDSHVAKEGDKKPLKKQFENISLLLFSMVVLLVGAHFTVTSATSLASMWGVSPVLIGMLIVGLGTTMPEFFFSLKSAREKKDSLAIGDILGTVLADATIVIGILALIHPFTFSKTIIYVAGIFMVAAAFILFSFMRSGRVVTKKEAFALFILWLAFVLIEFIVNT